MAKRCIFCGRPPENKTKEHVIPQWLIEMTGDPKRIVSFGTHNIADVVPKKMAFDQLTFPACSGCNGSFSTLETRVKRVIERLLTYQPLTCHDLNTLLDWLDKVRIGMWLGLRLLDGDPWGIEPNFHISQRIALHDRSVGIVPIERRHPGINLIGPESPCFAFSPTAMCLLINGIGLFNSSAVGLCSRRLGFPFFVKYRMRHDGLMEGLLTSGLERILRPVEHLGKLQSSPFIYQPILEVDISGEDGVQRQDTEYVKANALDLPRGIGYPFIQRGLQVTRCTETPSDEWVPDTPIEVREVYHLGRRWAYRTLEHHYTPVVPRSEPFRGFRRIHARLLRHYDDYIG